MLSPSSKRLRLSPNDSGYEYIRTDSREDWSINDVADFLEREGFVEFIDKFIEHRVDGQCLPYLNEDRLEKMGIEQIGDRLRLLNSLAPSNLTSKFKLNTDEYKIFNDPVHGHMELHPLCVAVINTPQFQRLRQLKQLGGCYFVFPGASHNRFEHCIGVAHLAGLLVRDISDRQPELMISQLDVICVMLAGLCHDLGHGPLSHMFDGNFIPFIRPGCKWTHEDASIQIFDYLIEDNNLKPKFSEYGIKEIDLTFIKEMIAGPDENDVYHGRDDDKKFLYQIVANKQNGIDVDKMDYFARDCHHLGIKNSFDHMRYIKFARVLEVDREKWICSASKEARNIFDMFHTRMCLHRQAYSHKTNRIVEFMMMESLIAANDHITFLGSDGKEYKMSDAIDNMSAYTQLNDSIFDLIKHDRRPELNKAREILERIDHRDLYKCIGQTKPTPKKEFSKTDVPDLMKQIATSMTSKELDAPRLSPDDFIVQIVKFDYSMGPENPVDKVYFYTKSNPDLPIHISREEVSCMLPASFQEQHLRVFCREASQLDVATKCFERWCATTKRGISRVGSTSIDLTPYKQEEDSFSSSQNTACKRKLENCY